MIIKNQTCNTRAYIPMVCFAAALLVTTVLVPCCAGGLLPIIFYKSIEKYSPSLHTVPVP